MSNSDSVRKDPAPIDRREPPLDKHELMNARFRDSTSPVWDMSQERQFIEVLLGSRFNFFLVVFGLVVAGAINAKSHQIQATIFLIGLCVCALLRAVIWRSYQKLCIILDDLYDDPSHPASILQCKADKYVVTFTNQPPRWLIGYLVPLFCCCLLLLGFALSVFEKLPLNPERKLEPVTIEMKDSEARQRLDEYKSKLERQNADLLRMTQELQQLSQQIQKLEHPVKQPD